MLIAFDSKHFVPRSKRFWRSKFFYMWINSTVCKNSFRYLTMYLGFPNFAKKTKILYSKQKKTWNISHIHSQILRKNTISLIAQTLR